jgi:hypothetical protein
LYYRGFTNKLTEEHLILLLEKYKITMFVDIQKNPDYRAAKFVNTYYKHIPEGSTASIISIDRIADSISYWQKSGHRIMIISYFGINRAPVLCYTAIGKQKEYEQIVQCITKPFFKNLVMGEL